MTISITEPTVYYEILPKQLRGVRTNQSGVYMLFNRFGEIIYIGQSKNLRRRLGDHITGKRASEAFTGLIARIRIYPLNNGYEREIYETFLINKYKPYYNIAKNFEGEVLTERIAALFNEYHELQARLIALTDEEREIIGYFRGLDRETGSSGEYDEYYDEDDAGLADLGDQLWEAERLKEIREAKRKVRSRISSVRVSIEEE